jgi:hypothetical protein
MFANNELPSFPQRLNRPSKQEDSLGTVQGAQSDSCKTRNDTAFDHAFQGQSRSAPAQVRMARKQDVEKPTDQVVEEKGEERDALLPRLAPVRIPTMGTKWEYYSGAPMPHGPHSPVGRRDSGEATEGPEAEKHGSPAERQFLPSTKSLTSSLSTGSNYSRTSQAGLKRKRSLPGTPGNVFALGGPPFEEDTDLAEKLCTCNYLLVFSYVAAFSGSSRIWLG